MMQTKMDLWDVRKSQRDRILHLLHENSRGVTVRVIRNFTLCHTARITELRKRGHDIQSFRDEYGRFCYKLNGR